MAAASRVSVDCTGPVTVAILHRLDGRSEPLLFHESPILPSGVFVTNDGSVLTGHDALDAQASEPQRYVAAPIRLLTAAPDRPDGEPDPVDLVAAVLRHVCEHASRAVSHPVQDAVVVVPTGWGPQRRTQMRLAAERAGMSSVELVDAATALANRACATMDEGAVVVVFRLLGSWCEASVLRRTGSGWDLLSTFDEDLNGLDRDGGARHAAELVARAVGGADLTGDAISAVIGHAPPTHAPAITAGLREQGILAPARTVADVDAAHGALSLTPARRVRDRGRPAQQLAAIALPTLCAPALLWFLVHTGVQPPRVSGLLVGFRPPPYMYTMWPSWGLVAVLVLLGSVGIAVFVADMRARRRWEDSEAERRRFVARGLLTAAGTGVIAGLVTAMLGMSAYVVVPAWFFMLATTGPIVMIAAVIALIALLIQHGYSSAAQWRIWLEFPVTATALTMIGLLTIEVWQYQTTSIHRAFPGLHERVAMLGAIAVGLAASAVLIRRFTRWVIASPVVIGAVTFTYSFTNMSVVIAILLAAIIAWWIARIRPAPA